MRSFFLTREDNVGSRPFDSINWLFETHIKEPDCDEYHYAMLVGNNEDSPERIDLWREEPDWNSHADRVWYASVANGKEDDDKK